MRRLTRSDLTRGERGNGLEEGVSVMADKRPYKVIPFTYEELDGLGFDVAGLEEGEVYSIALYFSDMSRGLRRWFSFGEPSPHDCPNGLDVITQDLSIAKLRASEKGLREALEDVEKLHAKVTERYGSGWRFKAEEGPLTGVQKWVMRKFGI